MNDEPTATSRDRPNFHAVVQHIFLNGNGKADVYFMAQDVSLDEASSLAVKNAVPVWLPDNAARVQPTRRRTGAAPRGRDHGPTGTTEGR